jgi:translation initiation factor IF-1
VPTARNGASPAFADRSTVQPASKVFGAALQAGGEVNRPYLGIDIMDSEKAIEIEGTIMHVLPGTMFRVALANNNLVLAHISGKMRKRFIRLTIGDRVKMHMSPYDTAKARIVYRL